MSFIEFLGFIISILAMVFLFVRKTMENRRRRLHPEEFEKEHEEEERAVEELLASLNIHLEPQPQHKSPPPPPAKLSPIKMQKIKETTQAVTPSNKFTFQLHEYHSIQKRSSSRGYRLVHQVGSPQDIIVFHEILGPPKGLKS
jgi:hypothetical protein